MKKSFWIVLCLIPFLTIESQENVISGHLKAKALWETHDYSAASQIYQNLLLQSLPTWQKARLYYNLGTTELSQQHPIEAIDFFQKVKPEELLLPRFGRDFFLNLGIAYLQYVDLLISNGSSFPQQLFFIRQGLRSFDQAKQIDCQIQKEEQQKDSSFDCKASLLLGLWIQFEQAKFEAVNREKMEQEKSRLNIKAGPAKILWKALEQSNQAFEIYLDALEKKEILSFQKLKEYFQPILTIADTFIPSVIEEQNVKFQDKEREGSKCQRAPWDQVIPLFDRGYQAVLKTMQHIKNGIFDFQILVSSQEQTIKDWEKALDLLLHPPQSSSNSNESEEELDRIGEIQEMHLQDEPQLEPTTEDLHTW